MTADEIKQRRHQHRLEYRREWDRKWREQNKIATFTRFGNKCNRCGFADYRALQIDHVHAGGTREHQKLGRRKFFKKVLSDTTGAYQLLCANCNWIKRYENNEDNKRFEKGAKLV
jgi:hypothetical protein